MYFRMFNILDEGAMKTLDIVIDTSLPAARMVRTLKQLKQQEIFLKCFAWIMVVNASLAFTQWCKAHDMEIFYIGSYLIVTIAKKS